MEPPSRGLQSIFDKYPNDIEDTKFTFLHENSLIGKTILLPQSVTLQDLKEQVRKDNDYPSDTKCEEGRGLKLIYPKDGIEMAAASYVTGGPEPMKISSKKKKTHKNCVDLSDQAKWNSMKQHWDAGTAHRRDVSLVKYSNEVANIIGSEAPASVTLTAAKRLCCIIGVPHNVTSLKRLKRNYIIFQAVHDLIKYRDPHVSKIRDNCEALSIACGCHLHWFLSQSSQAYRHQRTDGAQSDDDEDDADSDDGVGVPPEYEKYVRLNKMGQSVKATVKQMLAEQLDPSIIGLCLPETDEEKKKKEADLQKSKSFAALGYGGDSSDDDDEQNITYDAPTTEALLLALRKVTGAIRHRQHQVLLKSQMLNTKNENPLKDLVTNQMETEEEEEVKEEKKNELNAVVNNQTNEKSVTGTNIEQEGKEEEEEVLDENVIDVNSVITGDHVEDDSQIRRNSNQLKNIKKNKTENNDDVLHKKEDVKKEDNSSFPWLEHIDDLKHNDWEMCSDECLDVTAYLCLGALWCNLEKNEDAIWCHGEEVLSYALLLAIHGGVTDCESNVASFQSKFTTNLTIGKELTSSSSSLKNPTTPSLSSQTKINTLNKSENQLSKTGFKNEKNYILKMQSVATHLACYLLTAEPGLKKFLAAQTSCSKAQPILQSFTDIVSVILQNPSSNVINFSNNAKNANLTLILPGLAELTLSEDNKIAMCGATMIAGIVATSEYRALVSRIAAQFSLPAMLTYALKILFKRHAFRKKLHEKSLSKNQKQKLKQEKTKTMLKNENNEEEEDIDEDNDEDNKDDNDEMKSDEEVNDNEDGLEDAQGQIEVEGFNAEVLACLRGKNGNNAVSIFDHCMVAVWGLLHILYTRKANSGIEDHEVKSPSRKNRHHRHRHLQKQISNSKSFGVNASSISSTMFDRSNSEIANGGDGSKAKNTFLPKESALYEMAHVPTLPVCHSAMAVTSASLYQNASPIKRGQIKNKSKNDKMNDPSKKDLEHISSNLHLSVDDEDNVVPEGLVARILTLCSWNQPNAMDEYIVPAPSSPHEKDDKTSLKQHDDDEKNSVKELTSKRKLFPSAEVEEDEIPPEDGDTFDVNSCTNGAPFTAASDGGITSNVANNEPSSMNQHEHFVKYEKRPIGSGGSGYGPLSEVEIRCSLGCLSLVASVKCVETTALLGADGLARVLCFAEMDPELGASEEVQEVALSALAHLCSAADHKHLKVAHESGGNISPGSPNKRFFPNAKDVLNNEERNNGMVGKLRHRNSGFESSKQLISTIHENKVLHQAWAALKVLVNEHQAIERLAQLRQIVTAKARQARGSRGTSGGGGGGGGVTPKTPNAPSQSSFIDIAERERIKQRRWDMVKAVAVAIMHLSGLEQSKANQSVEEDKHEMGLDIDDINNINHEDTSIHDPHPSTGGTVAVSNSPSSTLFGTVSKDGDEEDKKKKETSPSELKAAEKQAALEQRSNALALVMVAAQARSLFARRRLECVAQQLWGDNKTVVTEACASVWLLGRSLSVRAALSRLCVDGRNKQTGKITGRHFPMIPRLIECASANGDDTLRGWALASITTLCSDPNFQKNHAVDVIPCLVNTLITYADEGDLKLKKKKEKREQQLKYSRREHHHHHHANSHVLPTTVNYVVGGASSTSAALAQAVSLGTQRLAALSISALLLLAYFHPPSLETLRTPSDHPDHRNNGFGGIEYSLYKICRRKDICRRVKNSAGHLLFLLCAQDLDNVISKCPSLKPNANGGFTTSTSGGGGGGGDNTVEQNSTGYTKRSHLIPPQSAGPLWRLNASAHRQHVNVQQIEEGTVLEELFLHMLYEEVCTDYEPYEPMRGDNDGDRQSPPPPPPPTKQFGVEFNQVGDGIGGSNGLNSPSAASMSFNQKKMLKDPSIPQAIEYGFLDGGDGDEFGTERNALIRLCLHVLTDLASRRDRAKLVVINNGGANIASKLIREARIENRLKYQMMIQDNENFEIDGAVEVGDDDEEEEEMVEGAGNTLKEEWKIIMPLHLILNCSTCEKAQPRLCTVTLDDLIRATMTLSGTHGSAALEVQLAYAALANISRNAVCRATIYKHSLAAGILPPGARDWTRGQQVRQQQQEKNFTNKKQNNNDINDGGEEEKSQIPLNWEYPGRHPLYHMIQEKNSKHGTVMSAPSKDKSFSSSFGRSLGHKQREKTNTTMNQTTLLNTKSHHDELTARPSTAPLTSKSIGNSMNREDSKNNLTSQSLEGSLLSHTANHPACSTKPELLDQIHPAVGLYHLATPPPDSTSTQNLNEVPQISNSLKDGDLLSSLGFSTGHFGGNNTGLSAHATSGVVDIDDDLTLTPFYNHDDDEDSCSDSDENNEIGKDGISSRKGNGGVITNKQKFQQQIKSNKDDKVGSHVASVQSWMFNSTIAKPPNGAPNAQRIATNPPVILPDPSAERALTVASNHPAAPLIAGSNSAKSFVLESNDAAVLKPRHYWDNEVFNPPGARTTRSRTCDKDIVDCHAERKEWLNSEGGLSQADTLAGGALASTFRSKATKSKNSHQRTLLLKNKKKELQMSHNKQKNSHLRSGGGQKEEDEEEDLNSQDNSLTEGHEKKGQTANKMAKHKLKVLRKVIETTNETNAINKTKRTIKPGNGVGEISLTINPPICRGNHFKFSSEKERPVAPVSPTKDQIILQLGNNGGGGGGEGSISNASSVLPTLPNSQELQKQQQDNRKSVVSALQIDNASRTSSHQNHLLPPNGDPSSSLLSTSNNLPLSRQKKKAVKSALAQVSTKKQKDIHDFKTRTQDLRQDHLNKDNSNPLSSRDPLYPEFENVLNRGPMTASERRTMKLRAASAFASAGATRITKPRKDVSKVWMWEHIEGSQVSQQAGLIPYQLPVHNPLAKRKSIIGNLQNGGSGGSGGGGGGVGGFHGLMAAAIASKSNSEDKKTSPVKDKFRNSMRIHTAQSRSNRAGASRIITAPFFFHLKTNPAAPFPPPPLPPPPPPNLRCDVFQRFLPTAENGLSADGASGGPEAQISGEWVKLNPGPIQSLSIPPSMPGPYDSVPTLFDPDTSPDNDVLNNIPNNIENPISGVVAENIETPSGDVIASSPNQRMNDEGIDIIGEGAADAESNDDNQASSENVEEGNLTKKRSSMLPMLAQKVMSKDFTSSLSIKEDSNTMVETNDIHSASRLAWLHAPREFDPLVNVAVGDHFVCGGMPLKNLSLLIRAPVLAPPPKPAAPPPPKIRGPPWDYHVSSIFVPRRTTTDAKSMVDIPHQRSGSKPILTQMVLKEKDGKVTADVGGDEGGGVVVAKPKSTKKNKPKKSGPFDHDWLKCLAKQDRFFNLIQKGATSADHPEVLATREALKEHYDWLMYIFLLYAADDVTATDASSMGWMSYGSLMLASGIQDQNSKHCKESDLDTIFKAANFEAKGSDPNDENPLDALTRQEWLEIIIRCTKAKYGELKQPISVLIPKLVLHMKANLTEAAEANEDPAAVEDFRHEWRLNLFYVEETDKVYREYEEELEILYNSKIDFHDVGHHKYWTLGMWQNLMTSADFYQSIFFTREEGNYAYYYSKFTVYDYVKDGDLNAHMDWLSFLEALGHVARLKELPSTSVLASNNFNNIIELFDRLELLNSNVDEFMEEHPTKPSQEDPFHIKLLTILQLMFYVLDKKAAIHRAEVAAEKLANAKAAAAGK